MSTTGRNHPHSHGTDADNPDQRRRLLIALGLTWGFAVVEAFAGWRGGSLALLADAGHMVTDGAALGLALLATWFAARKPSSRHSYGFGRAELFAALINALTMLAVVAGIAFEAWSRFTTPQPIDGLLVSVVAILGLLRDALHGLMDGVPFTIDLEHLGKELAAVPRVIEVHDLHVWSLSGERLALTAHVRIANLSG